MKKYQMIQKAFEKAEHRGR